ncbi:pyridoxamine 5'-phosphate oxidase family protein [Agrobacterium pusense]|uniref:pyridoxamine 5'-phosphate oxidase family protein n=1 Tax=Agrobacterium pusense TaxID=648995 RepID=UPI0005ED9FA1|nr:pyridoxamine 5'-phosphate oxidase family protein [Agrobacterium pusense]AUC12092.1 pyridoxamine 5-phosphate oxidase [Rhizobium sp. Y9]MBP2611572.1 putative pyridoxine 5'-phosphate oxidase superfamily flavin-nucleotide-binding protein [Agrobacterium pusense]PTV68819.1 pyridoxamine 5-phosphate oxidase [Agrobacterium pusense]WMW57865.1 pyridoxamine 5'-phosphate oxidase family protein [Agrobacterium pusense]
MSRYLDIATTPSVAAAQDKYGSAEQWARIAARGDVDETTRGQRLGPAEAGFIGERDGFYLASVSETGWPYVQYRGGPAGFLTVLEPALLGFGDFRGNRQYITTGNVTANDRVSLFLMDYAHRQRLKIFGRIQIIDAADDPSLAERLTMPDYSARVERLVLIGVEAFDWNCPQHITPRFTLAELQRWRQTPGAAP